MIWEYEHFDAYEFDSPDKPGSADMMEQSFVDKLHEARVEANIPFVINSGFRTGRYNKKIGGVLNSSHTVGYAADIACSNSRDRYAIVKALLKVGFIRIGIADTFIHVDSDPGKPQRVIWTY